MVGFEVECGYHNLSYNHIGIQINSKNEEFMRLTLLCCLIATCLLGCTPTKPAVSGGKDSGHSHEHQAPTTLAEAVKQLEEHAGTIGKAFAANKPDDAHGSLHDVRFLLTDSLPGLTKDLPEEKKVAIKNPMDELLACFSALDDAMHGGPETPYTEVGERITAATASLRSAIQ